MLRTLIFAFAVLSFLVTTVAEAQNRPRPTQRPPWQDVCCGGPCCAKPRVPQR